MPFSSARTRLTTATSIHPARFSSENYPILHSEMSTSTILLYCRKWGGGHGFQTSFEWTQLSVQSSAPSPSVPPQNQCYTLFRGYVPLSPPASDVLEEARVGVASSSPTHEQGWTRVVWPHPVNKGQRPRARGCCEHPVAAALVRAHCRPASLTPFHIIIYDDDGIHNRGRASE